MALRHFEAETISDSEEGSSIKPDMDKFTGANAPFWCKFPPGLIDNKVRVEHTPQMMAKAFDQLPFVQALLPGPFASAPSTSIRFGCLMDFRSPGQVVFCILCQNIQVRRPRHCSSTTDCVHYC